MVVIIQNERMDCDESKNDNRMPEYVENADGEGEGSPAAVNSLILDYYKKFGRKRDLEQYFSLSTAHGEVRDPTGLFWMKMKSQNESSDSGDKKSESPTEVCRISIKCSVPEQSTSSQEEDSKDKSESVSPPIITEDATKYSDGEDSVKSDNHSQKSIDLALDTSINKPFSPTSSITSQRKLEWDSLADVGYGNESDRKTSASSLSTLERLALKQQYSKGDTKQETDLGPPTAHSTFLDQSENKNKGKKGNGKKTTIHNRDIDFVELDLPQGDCRHQAISVNLTKHISFNVEKDGVVTVGNIKKDLSVTPEKENLNVSPEKKDSNSNNEINPSVTPENISVETEMTPQVKCDKQIQTSLTRDKGTASPNEEKKSKQVHKVPLLINLNSIKKKTKKKVKTVRKRSRSRRRLELNKENLPLQEKSGAQVSEAESFEYMPGHMYNQNQINLNQSDPKFSSVAGNKSSLESSGILTTDSSKASIHSFTRDLEKSIDLLKVALKGRNDDSALKKQLIKDIVQRLIKSNYKDDNTPTDFFSSLISHRKKIGQSEGHTTTSTSDGNHSGEKPKLPIKSILRLDKFNSNALASTSQSAPNLPVASASENPVLSKLPKVLTSSNTESDVSSEKKSSDGFSRTSSEELYQKYLAALRREEAYKRHLKDKENFLRQKLVSSDTVFKANVRTDLKANSKLQDLLKDLTRNNYDDGSGDASKLEGGANSNITDFEQGLAMRSQRSHSVFTLSSANSDCPHKKNNLKKRLQQEIKESRASGSKDELCQCGNLHIRAPKIDVADSSVQVNLQTKSEVGSLEKKKQSEEKAKNNERDEVPSINYVCFCADPTQEIPPNMFIYKFSRISDDELYAQSSTNVPTGNVVKTAHCHVCKPSTSKDPRDNNRGIAHNHPIINYAEARPNTPFSQGNVNLANNMAHAPPNNLSTENQSSHKTHTRNNDKQGIFVHEATRCIQTEISINTRIPEPCLRDINIICDRDLCKVVNESYRMITKTNSDQDCNNFSECFVEDRHPGQCFHKLFAAKDSQTDFELGIRSNVSNNERTLEKEVQSDMEINVKSAVDKISDKNDDNFSIPIVGTNMTLFVSIGSDQKKNGVMIQDQKTSQAVCEATATDEITVAEKATCLTEECTKGVQSFATQIFEGKDDQKQIIDVTPGISEITQDIMKGMQSLRKSCIVSTCVTNKKSYTYPRTVQINEQKPFLRSNTDNGRFISSCYDQRVENVCATDSLAQSVPKCECGQRKCNSPHLTSHDIQIVTSSEESSKNSSKYHGEASDDLAGSCKSSCNSAKDPIVDMIKDITRRYSKKDADKSKKRRRFKEIVTVLNYLLDTDDGEQDVASDSSSPREVLRETSAKTDLNTVVAATNPIEKVDKGVQLSVEKCVTESSVLPSSSDSATCKVLNKIKKECEKYHQKKCKSKKQCEPSSSTSNCNQCHAHYCHCRTHKCKGHRQKVAEKSRKKCLAYNLIIQTSDSIVSDDVPNKNKPLQHIVVKVPPKNKIPKNVPFKEVYDKIEKKMNSPRGHLFRSRSCPNESEVSSECHCPPEDCSKKCNDYTVRDYLEKNRPDFVEKSSDRQHCLKTISEKRANERAAHRRLLSLQLERPLSAHDLRTRTERDVRRNNVPAKFISEKEMKKHSEKIYKSLPEVVNKKEQVKKENIKKTNLLMANIFKKNLQKNTLRGAVTLSNYNTVIKI